MRHTIVSMEYYGFVKVFRYIKLLSIQHNIVLNETKCHSRHSYIYTRRFERFETFLEGDSQKMATSHETTEPTITENNQENDNDDDTCCSSDYR